MDSYKLLANAQLLVVNPITLESDDVKQNYYHYVYRLMRPWKRRKYVRAQLQFYAQALHALNSSPRAAGHIQVNELKKFFFSLPFDLVSILGYDKKLVSSSEFNSVVNQICEDLHLSAMDRDYLINSVAAATGDSDAWKKIESSKLYTLHRAYYSEVRKNSLFVRKAPYDILITATMSAGKSTLINALAGQNLSLMKNLACTSKIHSIIAKPFDDGYTSEYDSDLVLAAGKEELLNDNEHNETSRIKVGAFFHGGLSGLRLIIHDSPGVNSSLHPEHQDIAYQMLKGRRYKLLLYIMNATQLNIDDDTAHLEYVSKVIGTRPVIFIINRCDDLIVEGESSITSIVNNQLLRLESKGFAHPIICPISARAAYLARKSEPFSRAEQREFNNLLDKFEASSLSDYYLATNPTLSKPNSVRNESEFLILNSGFYYLEEIIKQYIK